MGTRPDRRSRLECQRNSLVLLKRPKPDIFWSLKISDTSGPFYVFLKFFDLYALHNLSKMSSFLWSPLGFVWKVLQILACKFINVSPLLLFHRETVNLIWGWGVFEKSGKHLEPIWQKKVGSRLFGNRSGLPTSTNHKWIWLKSILYFGTKLNKSIICIS